MTTAKTTWPDSRGRFGEFGGRYVPEILVGALNRLEGEAHKALVDDDFLALLSQELTDWVGRPTPLTQAQQLGDAWDVRLWLKREDLAHTGAHKINNALGQALLAQRMGATRVVAETGAGQHGVAAAAACARLGIRCTVYMGAVDVERQAPNVLRMRLFGAEVIPVASGDATLRAAIDQAMRHWVADPLGTYYLLGSVVGPHPYPWLVREFQRVIGTEARRQYLAMNGTLPDACLACVGGGSNAIGLFHAFLDDPVELVGIEAGGAGGLDLQEAGTSPHAATISQGSPGVLHGCYSMLLQDRDGQILETHSVSAGLDYPGVGPEHSLLNSSGRCNYYSVSDDAAVRALNESCRLEGVLPALETAHALAGAREYGRLHPGASVVLCFSGRGDKDLDILAGVGL